MDRFEAMSILLQAIDAGSLSEASRRLGLPLATVSRKVSELEAHLNASLLMRSAKGLTPTPAGRSFISAAKTILEQLNEAERTAAGEYTTPKGDLVVSAPVVFGRRHVLPVVIGFLGAYPEIDVRLTLSDRVAHLVDDQVDIALRVGHLPDSGLTASRIGAVRRVLCASPAYFADRGHPTGPDDLPGHICISFDGHSAFDAWRFEANGVALTAKLRARLDVSTVEAGIDAAVAGMGLMRALSYQVVDHIRAGTLALALEAFEPPAWPVHLLYSGQSRLSLKLRAFVDFVAPRLRQRLTDAEI